jgi:hypothetical protein
MQLGRRTLAIRQHLRISEVGDVNLPVSDTMGWGRLPGRVQIQVRIRVLLQKPDENLGHDRPPTGPSRSPLYGGSSASLRM